MNSSISAHDEHPPIISVIIPCLNEEGYVSRLLEDLVRQEDADFEVIVVDSDSVDGTVTEVERFLGRLSLRLVKGERKGPAFARNLGARHARGTWLIFLDADLRIPDPDFLSVMVGEAERRGLVTASSDYKVSSPKLGDRLGMWITRRYLRLLAWTSHPVALGFCILTRRDVFDSVGGFDRTLKVAEDYDYVSRSAGPSRRFAFIAQTHCITDIRRFEDGGRGIEFLKAIGYEIYRFTHGYRIEHDPFNYRFGEHKKPKL